ncbi:hypothetical protein [Streptomyces sp. sk2.1]|uniref:hypothetical protein n=1 Tax=Streptomyces sp. sk2.1 TaxID=2478959 RepID=UPI0011E66C8D|nr:hypothetical protein [Streptomyces sp. sk2.1]TXS78676.1 hypothetical protein EAO76_09970 [Streptomyces sp. sk2.1]
MSTTPTKKDIAHSAPVRSLTTGQITVLIIATVPMVTAGGLGAWGTYSNVKTVFPDNGTAAGVVAAGEGATFVLALVYVLLTLLGQTAPAPVRLGLWLLPAVASATGAKLAATTTEAVVYAVTPMAMCVSAEGIGLVARRVVVYCTGVDMEAQRRNADLMRRIAYHSARSERHPWERVQKWSALKAWRLMSRAGAGDAQLGSDLVAVQRDRLTEGADTAMSAMLKGCPEPTAVIPVSLPAEPVRPALEPAPEPGVEPAGPCEPDAELTDEPHESPGENAPASTPPTEPDHADDKASDQAFEPEPVLSQSEPTATPDPGEPRPTSEPDPDPDSEPQAKPHPADDEPTTVLSREEQQVRTLAHHLRIGEELTKTTAAQLLGVSPATAGRRLKVARDRIGEGTGLYL